MFLYHGEIDPVLPFHGVSFSYEYISNEVYKSSGDKLRFMTEEGVGHEASHKMFKNWVYFSIN